MTAILRILVYALLVTPCFAQQLPFFTKEGNWISLYTSSGAPAPVYTNSMHEVNYTNWLSSVAEYTFDDINSLSWTNGTTGATNDTSYLGINHITTVSGAIFPSFTNAGYTNYTARLDGIDDYLLRENVFTNYAGMTQMTISSWCYLTNEPSAVDAFGFCPIYESVTFSATPVILGPLLRAKYNSIFTIPSLRNKADFELYGNNPATKYMYCFSTNEISITNWHHIVGVWSGGSTTTSLWIYVDGIVANSTNILVGVFSMTNASPNVKNLIGRHTSNSAIQNMRGHIDSVKCYTIGLTSNQVWNLYQSTKYRHNGATL